MAGSPISNSTRILDANLFYGRLDIVRPHLMRRAFFFIEKFICITRLTDSELMGQVEDILRLMEVVRLRLMEILA